MHKYKIIVTFNGSQVQVYPKHNESGASFDDVCKRVGMMLMAEDITNIVVWRDEQEYRACQIEQDVKNKQQQCDEIQTLLKHARELLYQRAYHDDVIHDALIDLSNILQIVLELKATYIRTEQKEASK